MESVAFVLAVAIVFYNARRFWMSSDQTPFDRAGLTKQKEISGTLRNMVTQNQEWKD